MFSIALGSSTLFFLVKQPPVKNIKVHDINEPGQESSVEKDSSVEKESSVEKDQTNLESIKWSPEEFYKLKVSH